MAGIAISEYQLSKLFPKDFKSSMPAIEELEKGLMEAAGQRFLIDYGMEQGKNVYENQPLPVAPGEIDFVLTPLPPAAPWRTAAPFPWTAA